MQFIDKFNLSASALGAFETCPLKWAHIYLYKTRREPIYLRALHLGIAYHELLEDFYKEYKVIKWNRRWLIKNWPKYYYKYVRACDRKKDDISNGEKYLFNLHSILRKKDWFHPPLMLGGQLGSECYFKFPYKGHKKYTVNITGKIDLILKRKNEICVIDWKTGTNKDFQVNDLYESLQMILYSAALKKIFDIDEEKLFLVYFFTDKVQEFIIKNNHFSYLKKKINDFLNTYEKNEFKKKRGQHCYFCDFKYLCENELIESL